MYGGNNKRPRPRIFGLVEEDLYFLIQRHIHFSIKSSSNSLHLVKRLSEMDYILEVQFRKVCEVSI